MINSRYAVSAYHCFAGIVKMFQNVEGWPPDLKSLDLFTVVAGAYNSRKKQNESKFEIQVCSNALKQQILKHRLHTALTSSSCHLDKALNTEIGVECLL